MAASTGKLARDPMRPDAATESAQRARTIQLADTYLTHAIVEPDKDAATGRCIRMDYTMSNCTLIDHAIFNNVRPGHYRATYRLKLKSKTDDAGKDVWAGFGLYMQFGQQEKWLKEIGPKDFQTPGQYEDFPVEFDFFGESSNIGVNAFWRGQQAGGTVYGDYVKLEQLSDFSDAEIAQRMKYVPQTTPLPAGKAGLDVLVVNGLFNELYRLPETLALFGQVRELTDAAQKLPDNPDAVLAADDNLPGNEAVRVRYATVKVGEGTFTLRNYPKTYAELCQYRIVVLINVDATWLQFTGRAWLRDYVNAGGGLLVLGGNFSLGQGSFAGTFLADMLPVTVSHGRDLLSASLVSQAPRLLCTPRGSAKPSPPRSGSLPPPSSGATTSHPNPARRSTCSPAPTRCCSRNPSAKVASPSSPAACWGNQRTRSCPSGNGKGGRG